EQAAEEATPPTLTVPVETTTVQEPATEATAAVEGETAEGAAEAAAPSGEGADPHLPAGRLFEKPAEAAAGPVVMPDVAKKAKKKKKKKKVIGEHAFKDYYNFQEALGKLPPHRVLAINRGE